MSSVEMPSARMIQPEKAAHRILCRPPNASKAEAMCKDLVNAPRKSEAVQEGVAMVSFLGAGGKEITVECPKVDIVNSLRNLTFSKALPAQA